jgi:hypothetical protein
MKPVSVEGLIPGGIERTDRWHLGTDDGKCSRCGEMPPEDDVPLLIWSEGGNNMLRYCEQCLGVADPFNPHGSGPVPIGPREG